jgi:hypothetical protein
MIKKPTDISKLLAILLVVMLLLSSSNIVFAQNITAANAVNNNISNTELDNYKILNEVYQNYKKGTYTKFHAWPGLSSSFLGTPDTMIDGTFSFSHNSCTALA